MTRNNIPADILDAAAHNPGTYAIDGTGSVVGVIANPELMAADKLEAASRNDGFVPMFRAERPDYWAWIDLDNQPALYSGWTII